MNSKIFLSALLFGVFLIPAGAQDIKGNWRWQSDDGQQTFSLQLIEITRNRVLGLHCIEDFAKELTECKEPGDDYTVQLEKVAENIFQGNLLRTEGTDIKLRQIQLRYVPVDNTIMFTVTNKPQDSLLIPAEAVLRR